MGDLAESRTGAVFPYLGGVCHSQPEPNEHPFACVRPGHGAARDSPHHTAHTRRGQWKKKSSFLPGVRKKDFFYVPITDCSLCSFLSAVKGPCRRLALEQLTFLTGVLHHR